MADVGAVILAAGMGTRFGGDTGKAVALYAGRPLVRWAAEAALASRARPVVVVIGHEPGAVRAALDGLAVTFALNPEHRTGMASSLRAGLAALPADAAGALVLLADMPRVRAGHLDALVAEFDAHPDASAIIPTSGGRRGNPVLLSRAMFAAAAQLSGDEGARKTLAALPRDAIREVELDAAVLRDFDTAAELAAADEIPSPRARG